MELKKENLKNVAGGSLVINNKEYNLRNIKSMRIVTKDDPDFNKLVENGIRVNKADFTTSTAKLLTESEAKLVNAGGPVSYFGGITSFVILLYVMSDNSAVPYVVEGADAKKFKESAIYKEYVAREQAKQSNGFNSVICFNSRSL